MPSTNTRQRIRMLRTTATVTRTAIVTHTAIIRMGIIRTAMHTAIRMDPLIHTHIRRPSRAKTIRM